MIVPETDKPVVSVTIPTLDSAATLGAALRAVKSQTYPHIELIVVDSYSTDSTVAVARDHGAHVIQTRGKLLKARQVGTMAARGDYILLLDSDQILEPTAIERAVRMADEERYDVLFLEEHAYHLHTWLQRLFELDRRFIHMKADTDPGTAVMLPRFFRRQTLLDAFAAMPLDELADVVAQDHAIIHWEVGKITQRGAVVPHAVYHLDPGDVVYVLKHFYQKGKAAKKLDRNQVYRRSYQGIFAAKSRARGIGIRRQSFALASNLVLLLKGVPYLAGKWLG